MINYFQSSTLTKSSFMSFAVSDIDGDCGGSGSGRLKWADFHTFELHSSAQRIFKINPMDINTYALTPEMTGASHSKYVCLKQSIQSGLAHKKLWKAVCSTDVILLKLFTLFCHRVSWFLQKCHSKSFHDRIK